MESDLVYREPSFNSIEDELIEPYVSNNMIEFLSEYYSIDRVLHLTVNVANNDERMGFIKGVRDVIGLLKVIRIEQEGK